MAVYTRLDANFRLTYFNATLITLFNTMFLAALSGYCKQYLPEWAARIAYAFVPVYCLLNLGAYLSQITLVPALLAVHLRPDSHAAADLLLRLTLQNWPPSVVSFFNNLAYALLAIPSVIYAVALYHRGGAAFRLAAGLLALSGAASVLGVIGLLGQNSVLSLGALFGGGLYTLALICLVPAFWQASPLSPPAQENSPRLAEMSGNSR